MVEEHITKPYQIHAKQQAILWFLPIVLGFVGFFFLDMEGNSLSAWSLILGSIVYLIIRIWWKFIRK